MRSISSATPSPSTRWKARPDRPAPRHPASATATGHPALPTPTLTCCYLRVRVLGVDDFAMRRGDSYSTILVDLERRRPIDVLPGREAEPLATWLRDHPEVEIICRDRGGAYAEGARTGAPQAAQIADGWHLWKNLGEAVEKTVGAHHACIRTVFANTVPLTPPPGDDIWQLPPPATDSTLDVCGRERRLVTRTKERYAAVQQLLADGSSLERICRTLRLDRSTVRRFARATSIDELLRIFSSSSQG
ncbi:transposase [Streptomyces sp. NBC_00289]|uniref:transposase n=1 Tax=Streptomyces sp. NBC_00289 TaxID=2975703 RepID=UPI00352CB616